jgi:hypothetical protein
MQAVAAEFSGDAGKFRCRRVALKMGRRVPVRVNLSLTLQNSPAFS